MQLLQAGQHHLILLELEPDLILQGTKDRGFACEVHEQERALVLDLDAVDRDSALLLFDAAEQANNTWFSRCQFYVDARTGAVLQTPFLLANRFDSAGKPLPRAVRLQIRKELPPNFRFPGQQPVNEKVLYAVLFNFLSALTQTGVGVCGRGIVKPVLTGR
jgi:hypothetical protein